MNDSTDIVIRFVLTKVDGEFPDFGEFEGPERAAPHRAFYFQFVWDPTFNVSIDQDDIISCEVIYDGVTPVASLELGISGDEDIAGSDPSPILRFKLRRPADAGEFRLSVWASTYAIWPDGRDEPFGRMEDHNGYTDVLSESQAMRWKRRLAKAGYVSGKVLTLEQLLTGTPLW